MLGKSIGQNSLLLGVFAAVTAGLIAVTFQVAEPRIIAAERRAAQQALLEIIPQTSHNNDLLGDTIQLSQGQALTLGLRAEASIHVARLDGEVVAYAVPAIAPDGYSGDIRLIVGVDGGGTITGVRVLSHRETPGLGDKLEVERDTWILSFEGRSLDNPKLEGWLVQKDGGEFDQFTGATITPRAVVRKVKHVLQFFEQHHEQLQEQARQQNEGLPRE